ncbi:fumarylacetoacetate hydrolase family protein (plasmid) [Paraburkholderia sp. FT54]|uniref:fumarylacetoacetate hydrolase family protein n=1 Tax=Paraburkholderia sp. FT54 TaxID=3074437 RepID=UPI0028774D9A|nr:fumarylacetoacetate hydrolase family protein [Paraburkholderia sp. FT54]WNC95511.1 fumarylacetoacetate hydrolase family protein [Paraburkholderia sp. FT54]
MKLLRYGPAGHELPGLLDLEGNVRALRPIVHDIDNDVLSPEGLRFLEALDPKKLPLVDKPGRLGAPLAAVRQIVAIGLNYLAHANEAGLPVPAEPVVFQKSTSSISGPDDEVILPPGSEKTDWEIELGVVIGSVARRVDKSSAYAHIAAYCMVNDISERAWQIDRAGQWGKGKSFDTFTPIGPWLVTGSEVDPNALTLSLKVNGEIRQQGDTSDLIFDVGTLVSYVSQFMTLMPGDLIITGTPSGVGLGMKPPRFLAAGDVIDMTITGLGTQRHSVI